MLEIQKQCLWCDGPMNTKTKAKMLCSSRCHVAFHRHRLKHYPYLSPTEFKRMILDWLAQEVPNHPSPDHPAALLNEQVAEQWRKATKVIESFKDSLAGGL